jgi:YD repeat-containing protein
VCFKKLLRFSCFQPLPLHRKFLQKLLSICFFIAASLQVAQGQTNPNLDNGLKPYGSYDGSSIDSVSLQTGALNLRIPLFSYPQRGNLTATVVLRLGSKSWHNWEYDCKAANPTGCKGKWHVGPKSYAGAGPGSNKLGIYLAIDDGRPSLSPLLITQGGSSGRNLMDIPDGCDPNGGAACHAEAIGPPCPIAGECEHGDSDPSSGTNPTPQAAPGTTQFVIYSAYMPDGSRHYLWQQNGSHSFSVDGTSITCYGCSSDPTITNPQSTVTRDGTATIFNSAIASNIIEDRNGNLMNMSGSDSMGRSLYGALNGTATSDLGGCDATQSSAMLYSFPEPNGTATSAGRSLKFCFQSETLNTAFGAVSFTDSTGNPATIQESGPLSVSLIAKVIVLDPNVGWANSPAWSFEYNNGNAGGQNSDGTPIPNFGDLTKMTLPAGGTVSYNWITQQPCNSGSLLTPVSRWITQRVVDPGNGAPAELSQYSGLGTYNVVVTDALGNTVSHGFYYPLQSGSYSQSPCTPDIFENHAQWADGNGTVLKQVDTEYAAQQGPAQLQYMTIGLRKTAETVTLDDGNKLRTEFDYDTALSLGTFNGLSYGTLLQTRELPAGAASGSTPLRCTQMGYLAFGSDPSYLAQDEVDLVGSKKIFQGPCSGTAQAETDFYYDESAVQASGMATTGLLNSSPHTGTHRGNLTSTQALQLSPTGPASVASSIYLDTGLPSATTDQNQNTTNYAYDSAYKGAYLTKTTSPSTNGVAHIVSGTYDFNTGSVTGVTDQNSNTNSYHYDGLGRLIEADFADGGKRTLSYPTPQLIEVSVLNGANNETKFDGLGRTITTSLTSNPGGAINTDTHYDAVGRVQSVSNPYQVGASAPVSYTTYSYDGLGRKLYQCQQDNGTGAGPCAPKNGYRHWTYAGLNTTEQDEAGNSWTRGTDELDQLTSVIEPGSLLTSYGYDARNNLTSVHQFGASEETVRHRSFIYDSLSRLIQSDNFESGTTCYGTWSGGAVGAGNCLNGYDGNGNLLYKSDANGTVSTNTYDALTGSPEPLSAVEICQGCCRTMASMSPATSFPVDMLRMR